MDMAARLKEDSFAIIKLLYGAKLIIVGQVVL
jgi:hypothetical protein